MEIEDCWTAHQDGKVALILNGVAYKLDREAIERLKAAIENAEKFLDRYAR
jgi:hypothetical protein